MNLWIGDGRLTADPEIKYIGSGTPTCRFQVAISRPTKKDSESKAADYVEIVVWGTLAETCANSLSKGSFVSIRGKIKTWLKQPANGGKKTKVTEVEANSILPSFEEKAKTEVPFSDLPSSGEVQDEDAPF